MGHHQQGDIQFLVQPLQQELDLLAEALQAPDDALARELAGIFLAHRERRRREHNLEPQLAEYERQREWAEGLAKYAELEIWRQAATTLKDMGYQRVYYIAETYHEL